MAFRMVNALWQLWRHDGTSWVQENPNANDQEFHADSTGNGYEKAHEIWVWRSVNLNGEHQWDKVVYTDKYAPSLAPASPTISNVNAGLLDNHVDIGWAEAANHAQYDLLIDYQNYTDSSKNAQQVLSTPRNGVVTTRFYSAGANGDSVTAFLTYLDSGNTFPGPTAQVFHTIT